MNHAALPTLVLNHHWTLAVTGTSQTHALIVFRIMIGTSSVCRAPHYEHTATACASRSELLCRMRSGGPSGALSGHPVGAWP